MLRKLHIRNYALIDALDLDLHPGLNTITGETGAGKSILLGALGLILGHRADVSAIKQGEKQCVVEGVFDVSRYGLREFIEAQELDYEEELVIRRVVSDTGKSRAFVNDVPVTLATLKGLTERIIDIHSQHANLLLQDAQFQLVALDSFAGIAAAVQEYRHCHSAWLGAVSRLEELRAERAQAEEEYEYVAHQHAELEQAILREGEQEEHELRQKQLAHAEELASSYTAVCSSLQGGGEVVGILEALRTVQSSLDRCGKVDSRVVSLLDRVESARLDLRDVAVEVEGLLAQCSADPEELQRVEGRLGLIYHLLSKHRCASVSDLISLRDRLALRLEKAQHYDRELEQLEEHCHRLHGELEEKAGTLRAGRLEAGVRFGEYIQATLHQLGIPHAQFSVEVEELVEVGPYGMDEVRFLFSANQNQAWQPLARVASGGEISRVMLSLKRLMALAVALPTIVFDEIDTGVSGRVATQMGSILEEMGGHMQVINITHLPQIAARGAHHFVVYKEHASSSTQSHIRLLSAEEREHEIAKMLSGEQVSAVALENARELLNHTSGAKAEVVTNV